MNLKTYFYSLKYLKKVQISFWKQLSPEQSRLDRKRPGVTITIRTVSSAQPKKRALKRF
ncbi:hypothetical protein HUJ05_006445 [Dendroctonus ponderosae]|nr:hypothetical protein HUJ05_006445 [Dendroctonus ponderosae]